MKCDQCDRPVLYQHSSGAKLCLECFHKAQEIERWQSDAYFRQSLINMAMLNKAEDDMHAIVGFSLPSHRIPVEQIALAGFNNSKMTNIHISGSQIGVLNTGDLAKIDAVVTLTQGTDVEELGRAIQQLTEATITSSEITDEQKREIGELLAGLSDQVAGKRSKPMAMQILKGIEDRASGINGIVDLVRNVGVLITALFSGAQ
tara:strand:- start:19 stop:627 length:609 start_codon:yes stop_codon:yes gene_type:complete